MVENLSFSRPPVVLAQQAQQGNCNPRSDTGNQIDSKNRRLEDRKNYRMMLAMAPLPLDLPDRLTELQFRMVRCVDFSKGGVGIILPERPSFTAACFFVVRKNQPMYLVAQVRGIAEACYERRHQFRVGFQFTGAVAVDGSIEPLRIL